MTDDPRRHEYTPKGPEYSWKDIKGVALLMLVLAPFMLITGCFSCIKGWITEPDQYSYFPADPPAVCCLESEEAELDSYPSAR